MKLQIIQDNNGNATGVYIPINEWKNLKKIHKDLEELENEEPAKAQQNKKPSDFFGTLSKEEGEKMQIYVTQSRDEWNRNI